MKTPQATGNSAAAKKSSWRKLLEQWDLQALLLPGFLLTLLFTYVPMYGVVMGFQQYKLGDFPGFSEWVGFKHFIDMFSLPDFGLSIRNTLVIAVLRMLISFWIPIIFAVLMNELKSQGLKKTVQTVSYLPHFISWTVTAALLFDMLGTNGTVNELIVNLHIASEPIAFFQHGEYFWAIVILSDIWKELGWNAIIYISAITSVSQDMYEAADIDGATRLQKMWYITVQSIKPTIVLLFIFQVGGLLNSSFDQIMMLTNQMTNPLLREYADVIDTYIYRYGMSMGRFSFAAASGLFKSVINFALLLISNGIAGKLGETALF